MWHTLNFADPNIGKNVNNKDSHTRMKMFEIYIIGKTTYLSYYPVSNSLNVSNFLRGWEGGEGMRFFLEISGAHDFSRILGGHKFPYSFLPKNNHYISVLPLDGTGGPSRSLIVPHTLHLKVFIHYSISSLIDKYDWTTTHFSTSKHSNPIFEKSIKSTYSIVIFHISSAEKNFQTNGKENHVSSKNIRWKLV